MNRRTHRKQPRSNPFEYTRPIFDAERALTRDVAFSEVKTHIQRKEFVSILAPRQTGKTTFLYQLHRHVNNSVYLDLEGRLYDDLTALASELAARIEVPDASATGPSAIFQILRAASRRVFLIDEPCTSREVAVEFLRAVRAFLLERIADGATDYPLFVIAGSTDLGELTLEQNPAASPFNVAHVVYLDDFTLEQTLEFISRLVGDRFSADATRMVWEYTGGHPFLIQFLCYHLYGVRKSVIEGKLSHLEKLVDEIPFASTVNVQSMVRDLSGGPERADALQLVLQEILNGQKLPFALSHKLVRDLYLQGCLRNQDGYCAIRNPIYEHVLRTQFDVERQIRRIEGKAKAVARPRGIEEYFQKLKNFNGWVVISLTGDAGSLPYHREQGFVLQEESRYTLEVKIAKNWEPPENVQPREPLRITEGDDATEALEFAVRPESFYGLGFEDEQTCTFPPHLDQAIETCRFRIKTGKPTEKPFDLFVNVYQGVSLVQISRVLLTIGPR